MNLKDIEKIVKIMDEFGLSQFKLEQDETKIELKKGADIDMEAVRSLMASAAPMAPAPIAQAAPATGTTPSVAGGPPIGMDHITSPMVGTFYTSEKPESDPFIKIGDKVDAESVVCIIEAMKVFNEIQSEISGEIVEILVENGTPVQYGEPLFLVKTA